MIIIFDTNIWRSELGLQTIKGTAVKYYIKQNKIKIALPEVIRLEAEELITELISTNIQQLKKSHQQLLSIFGQMKDLVLPSDEEVSNKIKHIFPYKSLDIIEPEFSFANAKSAFNRVIKKQPPSHKNQQFKDCVIWNHCIDLLSVDDVILVTKDSAFYEGDDYSKGLNNILKNEIVNLPYKFNIFSDLTEVMTSIKKDIEIDDIFIYEEIIKSHKTDIDSLLQDSDLVPSDEYKVEKSLFITEDVNKLYLDLIIDIKCNDLSNTDSRYNFIKMVCNCSYLITENRIDDIHLEELGLFEIIDGVEHKIRSNIYLSGNITIGHKTIINKVKHKIE
jgi:hypothetical protein